MPLPLVSRPAAAAAGDDATVTRARRHIEPGHAGGWSSGRRAARSAPGDQPPIPGCAVLAIAAVQGVQIPGVPIPGASTPEASPAAASPQATGVISGPLARRLRHLQSVRKRSRHPPVQRSVTIRLLCRRETAARLTSILGQIIELSYRLVLYEAVQSREPHVVSLALARACGFISDFC